MLTAQDTFNLTPVQLATVVVFPSPVGKVHNNQRANSDIGSSTCC